MIEHVHYCPIIQDIRVCLGTRYRNVSLRSCKWGWKAEEILQTQSPCRTCHCWTGPYQNRAWWV